MPAHHRAACRAKLTPSAAHAQPERSLPLFVYGPTGGGKSGVLSDVLASLDVPRAIVDCVACATPRALYETCLNQLHEHQPCEANHYSSWCVCENPAQFVQGVRDVAQERGRVCLVFDRAERLQQQEKLLSTLLTLPTLVSLGCAEVRSSVPATPLAAFEPSELCASEPLCACS